MKVKRKKKEANNNPQVYNSVQFKLAVEKEKLRLANQHIDGSPFSDNPQFRGSMNSKSSS